jgi:adenosylhomocysteine nucleosidase
VRPILLLFLLLLAPFRASASDGKRLDDRPRTAVVSAFEPEWILLKKQVRDPHIWTVNGTEFIGGELAGRRVVLFLSGVSMVNAAMTTQLALDRFNIKRIVFSGVAGGIDPSLDVGDVVVPERWGQYLQGVFARRTGDGYVLPPGRTSGETFANFGMIYPLNVAVRKQGAAEPERRFWFDADAKLVETARAVGRQTELARCVAALCLRAQPKVVVGGAAISGPVFLDNAEFRDYAFATFHASVTDMETAAVAQVAYANDVPYIAFRSLSDLAGGDPGQNQARTFYGLASDNSAKVVLAFLAALPD